MNFLYSCMVLWLVAAMPHQLWAIPASIAQIIKQLESKQKIKKSKSNREKEKPEETEKTEETEETEKTEETTTTEHASAESPLDKPEVPPLTKLEQACLRIDEAIQDAKLARHPATWYYRGGIYEQLLRKVLPSSSIVSSSFLLDETLMAYETVKKLSPAASQFHSFALAKIAGLWSLYLEKGIRYAKHNAFDQALEHFAICRRILPEEATPLFYTAIVQQCHAQPEAALHTYKAYRQLEAPSPAIFRAEANIYGTQLKQVDQAMALLEQALISFPFEDELLEEQYNLYATTNQLPLYETLLYNAMLAQPKTYEKKYAYAYFLKNQDRIEEAKYFYQQILLPKSYETSRQIGLLWYNEAIKAYTTSRKLTAQKQVEQLCVGPQNLIWVSPCLPKSSTHDRTAIHLSKTLYYPSKTLYYPSKTLYYPFKTLYYPFKTLYYPFKTLYYPFKTLYTITDCPWVQWSWIKGGRISDQIKADTIPYTAPLFLLIKQKITAALTHHTCMQVMLHIEKCLQQASHYLKIARSQNKKDKTVAEALYYTYYHLQKYRSAYRLLHAMHAQKHYLDASNSPFCTMQENEEQAD